MRSELIVHDQHMHLLPFKRIPPGPSIYDLRFTTLRSTLNAQRSLDLPIYATYPFLRQIITPAATSPISNGVKLARYDGITPPIAYTFIKFANVM